MIKKRYKTSTGFTLIEVLIALLCIGLCTIVITPCIKTIAKLSSDYRFSDDRIAIHQLRFLLAQSHDIEVMQQQLRFRYQKDDTLLTYDRNRLVRKDGYEIFLEAIDDASFVKEDTCVILHWKRGVKTYEAAIVCE